MEGSVAFLSAGLGEQGFTFRGAAFAESIFVALVGYLLRTGHDALRVTSGWGERLGDFGAGFRY